MAEQLTTELEAVNAMLSAVGESRVNTISGSLPAGLQAAVDLLRETSRQVQLVGWHFNTEEEYELSIDVNGYIYVAQNVLDCDLTVENGTIDVVQRGNRLYDRKNHTYVFDGAIECTIIWFLPWTQLPESARNYIKIKAARIYQDQTVGSESHHRYTQNDEAIAWTALISSEVQNQDATIFDNWDVGSIVARKRPYIIHR
jgi:hypothetical protein